MTWLWIWVWVGAVLAAVATLLVVRVVNSVDTRATRKRLTVRQRQYEAEAAMTRLVQNTITEMFDAVRQQP